MSAKWNDCCLGQPKINCWFGVKQPTQILTVPHDKLKFNDVTRGGPRDIVYRVPLEKWQTSASGAVCWPTSLRNKLQV